MKIPTSLRQPDSYLLSDRLETGEKAAYGAAGALIWTGICCIFFHSVIPAFATMLPFLIIYFNEVRKIVYDKRCLDARNQFGEAVEILSSLLLTGWSAENAISETQRQLEQLEGKDAYLTGVMQKMRRQLAVGVSAEEAWADFAGACGIEEVREFARAFALAKRSGASMPSILKKVSEQISLKISTEAQIETMLAGKRLEQSIMNLMPAGILCYVSAAAPQLLQVMYTTISGRLIMAVCLTVYAGTYILSIKIVNNRR